MAGTDRTSLHLSAESAPETTPESTVDGPAMVLVGPQIGENIGAAARAMMNGGLSDLRLVQPRDGWPNPKAYPMASGADSILDNATVFTTVEEAVADLGFVLATTARGRDQTKESVTAREAAAEMRRREAEGTRCGVLFGPERIGLTNDEVALADAVLTVPLNPGFSSLNLGQAVLLIAYEHFQAGSQAEARSINLTGSRRATREELFNFFDHLESALDAAGYWRTEAMRPTKVRNLRNVLHRADLTEQEIRTLHGVVTALVGRKREAL